MTEVVHKKPAMKSHKCGYPLLKQKYDAAVEKAASFEQMYEKERKQRLLVEAQLREVQEQLAHQVSCNLRFQGPHVSPSVAASSVSSVHKAIRTLC